MRMPTPVRCAFVALAALGAACLARLAGILDAGPLDAFLDRGASPVLLLSAAALTLTRALLQPEERTAWILAGTGLALWGIGDIYFRAVLWSVEDVPIPSPSDFFWLVFYLPIYASVALLLRERARHAARETWMNGVIAGLAVAAVAATITFEAALGATGGPSWEVATNLAYPIADMLLIAVVIGALAVTGPRIDSTWLWIGAGLTVFAVADSVYLHQTAMGTYVQGSLVDSGWPLAGVLIAWGAWRPAGNVVRVRRDDAAITLLPVTLALVGLGILFYDHFHRVNLLALGLASACLLAVIARVALALRMNAAILAESRREAMTDALTGLGNRRKLLIDLERAMEESGSGEPVLFALFDLDGFKAYNDTFGHPAGDALLSRLAGKLLAALDGRGSAYRIGGDEFCVLAHLHGEPPELVSSLAAAALIERGEGFWIECSVGRVLIPDEADTAAAALRIADQRMYERKNARRPSASRQSADVLRQALHEGHPDVADHLDAVSALAVATAEHLGLAPEEVEWVRIAAQLHDIGKMAIPDAIINKRDPLTPAEWAFLQRHTEIGERIVSAAPDLAPVAPLVRAIHESWDGAGYPDAARGEEIPLGSRIIGVCDAYEAMTSQRPYRAQLSREEALAEIRRCAGTQFDPRVVESFCAVRAGERLQAH